MSRGTARLVVAGVLVALTSVLAGCGPGPADSAGPTAPGTAAAPAPPTAAELLAAAFAQSRRDGSAAFVADPGDFWRVHYFGSTGQVRFEGAEASLRARFSDPAHYIREIAVVDGRRWLLSIYSQADGGWGPCAVHEGGLFRDACVDTLYQQDVADPIGLLVRAGPAARLTGSGAEVVDGVPTRWFDATLDTDAALRAETDPEWRARFTDSLLVGPIRIRIGPDDRLLEMMIPLLEEPDGPGAPVVRYSDWGAAEPVRAPG